MSLVADIRNVSDLIIADIVVFIIIVAIILMQGFSMLCDFLNVMHTVAADTCITFCKFFDINLQIYKFIKKT